MAAGPRMNLPFAVPWKPIAVSEDMMDTRVGTDRAPAPWRSSMAIYAYEPPPEDLPPEHADRIITYVKVTCSVTGYEPTVEELEQREVDLDALSKGLAHPDDPYFACYGAMLNVSALPVIPQPGRADDEIGGNDLSLYPRIVSFEPKQRQLYQAVSETSEALSEVSSSTSTNKSNTDINKPKFGVTVPIKGVPVGANYDGGGTSGGDVFIADASRERRETEGSTTQLNQVYSLLSSLHEGTNRAVLTWFPNPNQRSVTDRLTFPYGVEALAGIQDFMFIVSRPKSVKAMCIEATLDTGHYPEAPVITVPEPEFEYMDPPRTTVPVTRSTTKGPVRTSGWANPGVVAIDVLLDSEVEAGWEWDPDSQIDEVMAFCAVALVHSRVPRLLDRPQMGTDHVVSSLVQARP